MWLCFCLSYFFITRPDEVFANDAGVAHSIIHGLTRGGVAFFARDAQVDFAPCWSADRVEVRYRGYKAS